MTPLIEHIQSALTEASEIPLWGNIPSFPWEQVGSHLAKSLHLPQLQIHHTQSNWVPTEELLKGMGANPYIVSFECAPLSGTVHWIMSLDDVAQITSRALSSSGRVQGFTDSRLQEGYYLFLLANVLSEWRHLHLFGGIVPKIASSTTLPQENSLCADIKISWGTHSCWGRLVCSPALHRSLKTHFDQEKRSLKEMSLSHQTPLALTVEVGKVTLPLTVWNTIQVGDCLLLDRCSYDPKEHKGTVGLALNATPLFHARLKSEEIKILDYAFYYEEPKAMDQEDLPPSDELPEEELSSISPSQHSASEPTLEKMVSSQEIPLMLTVEVAKLQLTLEKLLELQPGNVLPLAIRPESGVHISVNGKRIARGELIKIGESIGVKILDLG